MESSLKQHYWRLLDCLRAPKACLRKQLNRWLCPLRRLARLSPLRVDICNDKLGFFANLTASLQILAYCKSTGREPLIWMTSRLYTDAPPGSDWFGDFFERIQMTDRIVTASRSEQRKACKIRSLDELGFPENFRREYYRNISLESAKALFDRHIKIKPEVREAVDRFCDEHFTGHTVLGVHYRGTDKVKEAEAVSFARFVETINEFLTRNPNFDCIFVTSDQQDFIDHVSQTFPHMHVCAHEDTQRSSNGMAVHMNQKTGGNYAKGFEALVNCLTLARCNVLMRTTSLLSAWASVFNSSMPVILLNKPLNDSLLWFPEREVAERALKDYV